jgi:hypothetical protein
MDTSNRGAMMHDPRVGISQVLEVKWTAGRESKEHKNPITPRAAFQAETDAYWSLIFFLSQRTVREAWLAS